MITETAFIAMNRFGLGPNEIDRKAASRNPRKWLTKQINDNSRSPAIFKDQQSTAAILTQGYEDQQRRTEEGRKIRNMRRREHYRTGITLRTNNLLQSDQPFTERLVLFWSNHFTVSRTRGIIAPAIPSYENEAIRPNIYGRFEDMLLSVVQHPCMLIYLDNISSIGPNSRQGQRRKKDLNENLAREILELHTLGVGGGYSQEDVTSFANILTGWTVARPRKNKARKETDERVPGAFEFRARAHEPGPQTLLGKSYDQSGYRQGVAALRDIARHPSTATFIATKLVRHFISDNPDQKDVEALADIFRQTGGDLAKVSQALIKLDSAWKLPASKVKPPYDMVISVLRSAGLKDIGDHVNNRLFLTSLRTMGQYPFAAPSPAGWPDVASHWIAPENLTHRLEWINEVVGKIKIPMEPLALFENTIAPVANAKTEFMIKGAPSRQSGHALIFSSAAFQRR